MTHRSKRDPQLPPLTVGKNASRVITLEPGEGTSWESAWFELTMERGLRELYEGRFRRQYNYQIVQGAAQLDFSRPIPAGITAIALQVAMTATVGTVTGWFRLEESGNVSPNGPGLSLPAFPLAAAILENRGRAQAYGIAARVKVSKAQGRIDAFSGALSGSIVLSDPLMGPPERTK